MALQSSQVRSRFTSPDASRNAEHLGLEQYTRDLAGVSYSRHLARNRNWRGPEMKLNTPDANGRG